MWKTRREMQIDNELLVWKSAMLKDGDLAVINSTCKRRGAGWFFIVNAVVVNDLLLSIYGAASYFVTPSDPPSPVIFMEDAFLGNVPESDCLPASLEEFRRKDSVFLAANATF
jgi:hypothetical protein